MSVYLHQTLQNIVQDGRDVQVRALVQLDHGRVAQVLLLKDAGDRVLVLEDEVHFVGGAALVGAEHDRVRAAGVESFLVEFGLLEQLDVCAIAAQAIRCVDFVLKHKVFGADLKQVGKRVKDSVTLAGGGHREASVGGRHNIRFVEVPYTSEVLVLGGDPSPFSILKTFENCIS